MESVSPQAAQPGLAESSKNVKDLHYAEVVAQLVERSLPTPEVRGSNPISDQYSNYCNSEKTKIKEKEAGN